MGVAFIDSGRKRANCLQHENNITLLLRIL